MTLRRSFHVLFMLAALVACVALSGTTAQADDGYPNGNMLVSAQWLQSNLGMKSLAVIDTRTEGFEAAHVPGAVNLTFPAFRPGKATADKAKLEALLSSAGLRRDMKFVVYDDPSKGSGAAGWFFWLLESLGCTDVHVLDGGWSAWVKEGGPKEAGPSKKAGKAKFEAKVNGKAVATAASITARQGAKDFVALDIRPFEEFNGWQLHGEPRGGHIPGAVNVDNSSFYGKEMTFLPYKDMKAMLDSRGVTQDKETVVYCTAGRRAGDAYFVLRLMGYPRVANYDGALQEWAANPALPMEKLARYEKLVYPAWVKALIDGKNPPTFKGGKFMVLEVRYIGFSISQQITAKNTGYIPGAVSIHPCYVEHGDDVKRYYPDYVVPDDARLLPGDRLLKALAKVGITKDMTVVVYSTGRVVPMTASRVAWALMYAGVEDVRILNGGFKAWEKAGYPVADKEAQPTPAKDFGAKAPVHPEFYATPAYVLSVVKGQEKPAVLVDVRKRAEYDGKMNPYPFFSRKGRIPGAVWQGDWDVLVNTKDDTYRSYPEVQRMWKNLGVTPDKEAVFYCGTGWRSTIGFFQAYLMGFGKMRNFDGSFYVWSSDEKNPVIRPE